MAKIVAPPGLSAEREWYLYDQIREHCDPEFQDGTCPKPSVPKPKGREVHVRYLQKRGVHLRRVQRICLSYCFTRCEKRVMTEN